MNALRSVRFCLAGGVAALAVLAAGAGLHPATAAQRGQPGVDEGVQVLLRGPVHEAFAEAVSFDPQPGVIVPRRPPDPIEELPPDQRPAGANVTWIPGYWAWDDERSDFLWVSGTWRALPPGRQWVSGYWGQSTRGFQWIAGYWADAAADQIEYLPEPPATVESGPNLAAPSADHNWIPGCWVWQQGRFAWRPGYWAQAHPDWTWVPAHYVWSPRGYVFVDGYWDYSIARRGVLFAPVYFRSPVYTQRSYSYSPRTAISLSVLASHLFVRPSYQHYYFGDYYGTSYSTAGYYPSFSFHSSRSGYDPIYAQQRWRNRHDHEWEQRRQAEFQRRRDQESARPPHTWEAQQERMRHEPSRRERSFAVGEPFEDLSKSPEHSQGFRIMTSEERRDLAQRWQAARELTAERQQWENNAARTAVDPRVPRTDPRFPATDPRTPRTDPRAPATDPRVPTTDPRVPTTDPRVQPTDPRAPTTDPRFRTIDSARNPATASAPEPVRVPFRGSPFRAKPVQGLGPDQAPPQADQPPQVDLDVPPQPRQPPGQAAPRAGESRPEAPSQPPRPEPRKTPAPTPKVEPRAGPPVDLTPPKAEPQPAPPKAQPQPESPKAEPQPTPTPTPGKPDKASS